MDGWVSVPGCVSFVLALWEASGVGKRGRRRGGESVIPRVDRRVVALVIERIALPQRAEAPPEIIDERPRQEGLLPAGA